MLRHTVEGERSESRALYREGRSKKEISCRDEYTLSVNVFLSPRRGFEFLSRPQILMYFARMRLTFAFREQ